MLVFHPSFGQMPFLQPPTWSIECPYELLIFYLLRKLFFITSMFTLVLEVFGCACYPLLRPHSSYKLNPRSKQCIFVGYSLSHKGYKYFDPVFEKTYLSRHVVFNESHFPFQRSPPCSSSPISFSSSIVSSFPFSAWFFSIIFPCSYIFLT